MPALRVLVTGASGRIARRMRSHPLGHQERVFVGRTASGPGDATLDLRDRAAVRELLLDLRPDVVVHLAALSGAAAEADPIVAHDVNVTATRHLAEAAAEAGAERLVFASTAAVYGDAYQRPATEDSPTDARSSYARTKLEAEYDLARVAESGGIRTVALRIFNIYGAGFEDSLIWKLSHSSSAEPTRLRGFDTFVRDYSDADSIVTALVAATTAPLAEPHTLLNVGTGVETSNRRLVELLGRDRAVHYEIEASPPSYSCADVTSMHRVLGLELPPLH